MRFPQEVLRHLSGERFSSGLALQIAHPEASITSRFDLLVAAASGRRVVHLGFADHAELVDRKISRDDWLHGRLCRVATRCVGIDVNADAVEHIRRRHGYEDIFVHDLTSQDRLSLLTDAGRWDWLFMPEMLEHVDNPVHFLTQVRILYGDCIDRALITVPNAWELTNLRFLLRQREYINTDHRYWFTPYTLAKVCLRAGWHVDEFIFCQGYRPSSIRERALLRLFPSLRECIAMTIRP